MRVRRRDSFARRPPVAVFMRRERARRKKGRRRTLALIWFEWTLGLKLGRALIKRSLSLIRRRHLRPSLSRFGLSSLAAAVRLELTWWDLFSPALGRAAKRLRDGRRGRERIAAAAAAGARSGRPRSIGISSSNTQDGDKDDSDDKDGDLLRTGHLGASFKMQPARLPIVWLEPAARWSPSAGASSRIEVSPERRRLERRRSRVATAAGRWTVAIEMFILRLRGASSACELVLSFCSRCRGGPPPELVGSFLFATHAADWPTDERLSTLRARPGPARCAASPENEEARRDRRLAVRLTNGQSWATQLSMRVRQSIIPISGADGRRAAAVDSARPAGRIGARNRVLLTPQQVVGSQSCGRAGSPRPTALV
jgi:hypothetical protein